MTKTENEMIHVRVIGRTTRGITGFFPDPKNTQCAKLELGHAYNAVVRLQECVTLNVEDLPILERTLKEVGVPFATHNEIISLAMGEPGLLAEHKLATVVEGKICLVWGTPGKYKIDFDVTSQKLIRGEAPHVSLVFARKE